MANNTLAANVAQAISDFDGVEAAISGMGVSVPSGTDTAQYGALAQQGFYGVLSGTKAEQPTTLTLSGLTPRHYAFAYMQNLQSIVLSINGSTINMNMFLNCTDLTNVTLTSTAPEGITTLGFAAFQGCTSLASITLPSTLTTIGGSAFSGCSALTLSELPTGITVIPATCFKDCTSMTAFTVHSGVTSIAPTAFSGCTNLQTITVNKPQNSLVGAPWGAANATVVWTG